MKIPGRQEAWALAERFIRRDSLCLKRRPEILTALTPRTAQSNSQMGRLRVPNLNLSQVWYCRGARCLVSIC